MVPGLVFAGHRPPKSRSLLFVAATRARDALVITWNGHPSPFLPPAALLLARAATRSVRSDD